MFPFNYYEYLIFATVNIRQVCFHVGLNPIPQKLITAEGFVFTKKQIENVNYIVSVTYQLHVYK